MKHKLKSSIVLGTTAFGVLHLVNKLITATALSKNVLKTNNGTYFNWRFGNIYYTKSGSGAPLLLIHDTTPSSSSYEWSELIDCLSKQYTVYAIDLIGCGRSDKPNFTYTNYLYVQLITEFIKEVIGEKVNVAASNYSTSFTILACYSNPDLFNKIMLINPPSVKKLNRIPDKKSKIIKYLLDLPIIGTTLYYILSSKDNIEYTFTEDYLDNPFHLQQKQLNAYYEGAHTGDGSGKHLLSSIEGNYLTVDVSRAIKEINNSIFIVSGSGLENEQKIAEEYVKLNASIECSTINHAKKLPQVETPEEISKLFKIFF